MKFEGRMWLLRIEKRFAQQYGELIGTCEEETLVDPKEIAELLGAWRLVDDLLRTGGTTQ